MIDALFREYEQFVRSGHRHPLRSGIEAEMYCVFTSLPSQFFAVRVFIVQCFVFQFFVFQFFVTYVLLAFDEKRSTTN